MSSILPPNESMPPSAVSEPEQTTAAAVESLTFGGYAVEAVGIAGVSFWPRVGARIIDNIVHYVFMTAGAFIGGILVALVAIAAGQSPALLAQRISDNRFEGMIFGLIGYTLYHVFSEGIAGCSLGKLIFGQVVVREDGTPCGMFAALKRSLLYVVDAFFFGLVGYLAMQKNAQEQRHGDVWAKTIVAKRNDIPAEKRRGAGWIVLGLLAGAAVDAGIGVLLVAINVL